MKTKTRVAVLFGGRSAEHEVSLQSARNVVQAMDPERYETVLIGIDRSGAWYLNDESLPLLNLDNPAKIALQKSEQQVSLIPGDQVGALVNLNDKDAIAAVDVVFPVLHGPYGEDGSVQGLTKLANVPCVGSDILGSAIGMDKDVAKRLLRDAGIPVARHLCVRHFQLNEALLDQVEQMLGFPVYVKPANMGSSVGVVKVTESCELLAAIENALQYDTKIIVEESIRGREIECSVLGNDEPITSVAGEIVTDNGFYSYESKYIDDDAARLIIPADLDPQTLARVQALAINTFRTLETRGMARVDMFLTDDGQLLINEINTIPGFTEISMYPKLWQESGISYQALIDKLIELAIEEHNSKKQLKTTGY